ncbi:acetate--CoA ligase family protein [Actinomadura sp. DC4]|uniref:acetate--CoA ligase family protein n=1 Tax=Actinomadura sp. DC4 TaxID=3055069 RepID=UPI0025B0B8A1|nr:acetate--CoA ligase family protein [Actinomadura sp. DC4]MDN3356354.1 acetate--CoA ligase family protein [Actinomadura sp. DC4]
MTADAPGIGRLLAPRTVAVLGSLSRESGLGARTVRHLRDSGFPGRIITARSAEEVPGEVDVAVVAVPAAAVPEIVDGLDGRAAHIVVYSSGFEEAGGAALKVASGRTRIIGPNSVGLYHAPSRAVLTFAAAFDDMTECRHGSGVVLLSQSGAFGARLVRSARRYGLDLDGFVGTGNETDYGACDIGAALVADPEHRPRVLALYLESVRDGGALERLLRTADEAGVPVITLLGGSSAAGADAARSHTAAVSPDHAVATELCCRYGAVPVTSDRELVEAAVGLSLLGRARGGRVGIITGSGGAGVVAADMLAATGLRPVELTEPTRDGLGRLLPSYASTANPVDVTAQVIGDTAAVASVTGLLAASGEVDSVLVIGRAEQAAAVAEAGGPDVPVVTTVLDGDATSVRASVAAGLAVLPSLSAACAALHAVTPSGERTDASSADGRRPLTDLPAPPPAEVTGTDTAAGLRFVAAGGVRVAPWREASDVSEALAATADLGGPIVMKANLPAEAHKAARGGVRLDLRAPDVAEAAGELLRLAPSVIVARQLRAGPELIVGVRRDPVFGLVVVAGLGGGDVELIGRVVTVPASVSADGLADRLAAEVFDRGGPRYRHLPALLAGTAAILVGLARRSGLDLVECNPLVEMDNELIALDARVVSP